MTSQVLRVVVFSSIAPAALIHLVTRMQKEVPEAQICGILYERRDRTKRLGQRILEFTRNLRDRDRY